MDENPEADPEEFEEKQKEVEAIANPIMRELYQSTGAGGPGGGGGDDDEDYDFGDDEL
jgi:heat shock protein 5